MADAGAWAFDILGIDGGSDADPRAVKRAYARLLKLNRPEDDPAAFQLLNEAYQAALAFIQHESVHDMRDAQPAQAGNAGNAGNGAHFRPAEPALPDPHATAETAWALFLASAGAGAPLQALQAIEADDAMLSFAARDAFQFQALRHAARPECGDDLRDALVEHFGWHDDAGAAARIDRDAAREAYGRYRAAHLYSHYKMNAPTTPCVAALLADAIPRNQGKTADSGFTRDMKQLIETIRWHHPELLAYRLNADVFAWWEQKVAAKKYFAQTAMWSFIGGVLLHVLAYMQLNGSDLLQSKWGPTGLFFLCQLATFSAVALLVFHPPRFLYGAVHKIARPQVDIWLHERRHWHRWQFGWMAPFAVLGSLMLVSEPGTALQAVLNVGLFLCAAASVFAGSLFMSRRRFVAMLVLASINAYLMQLTGFGDLVYASCLFFSIGLFTVALQHGDHLYGAVRLGVTGLVRARIGWLCAGALLFFASTAYPLSDSVIIIDAFVLLLTGVLLARMVVNSYLAWAGLVALRMIFSGSHGLQLENWQPQLRYLVPALCVTAFFMLANMFQAHSDYA